MVYRPVICRGIGLKKKKCTCLSKKSRKIFKKRPPLASHRGNFVAVGAIRTAIFSDTGKIWPEQPIRHGFRFTDNLNESIIIRFLTKPQNKMFIRSLIFSFVSLGYENLSGLPDKEKTWEGSGLSLYKSQY